MLPKVEKRNLADWKKIHDTAQSPESKALIGALMLLAWDIESAVDRLCAIARQNSQVREAAPDVDLDAVRPV